MKKERLDKLLVDLGYFENKSKASASIMSGSVKINDEVITKSGFQMNPSKEYDIQVKSMPYVSRGGFKLKKALDSFDVVAKDRVCFDAGASTGGFTDCLLQNGAKKVYAVDVGYGQIAWKIRSDERVKVIERTNIKSCDFEDIYGKKTLNNDVMLNSFQHLTSGQACDLESAQEKQSYVEIPDLLVMDVSFISIEKILPNLKKLLNPNFHELVCLIKPQFEAGKDLIEKGGVVRDKNVHIDVINRVIEFAKGLEYIPLELTFSSIKGPAGNIEYLIHLATSGEIKDFVVEEVVESAFVTLN